MLSPGDNYDTCDVGLEPNLEDFHIVLVGCIIQGATVYDRVRVWSKTLVDVSLQSLRPCIVSHRSVHPPTFVKTSDTSEGILASLSVRDMIIGAIKGIVKLETR